MGKDLSTREKIITAALAEFGKYGYKDASTNRIYPVAEVSKGAIFKIFGSKAKLFYAVFDDALNRMLNELGNTAFDHYHDIFERIFAAMIWKVEYSQNHPFDTAVMLEGIADPPNEIKELIFGNIKQLTKLSMHMFFEQLPMDNIRDEYTKEQVIHYLEISVAGLQATIVDKSMNMEKLTAIREDSINYLKTVVRGMEKNNG